NVLDALAPSNYPWSNPTVMKASVDEGGMNLVRGARRFLRDFPGLPATVDTSKFAVGENLALTPGAVVLRTDVLELIQYAPQTAEIREVPLLFAPPTINKFYVLDLAPGRSMVEWLVQHGQQVFVISWRNPDVEQGHFDLDTYAQAVLEARDAVADITGQTAIHLHGAVSGGILRADTSGDPSQRSGLGRDHRRGRRRPPGGGGAARRGREPEPVRGGAGQRARRHGGGARQPGDRRRGGCPPRP